MRATLLRRSALATVLAAALACAAASAHGQVAVRAAASVRPVPETEGTSRAPLLGAPPDSAARRLPWWTPFASAVVPGAGQAMARQARAAGYLALEVYAWVQYGEARSDANRASSEYRRIAREAARQPCTPSCPDGNWDYYELLEKAQYVSSGRFDAVPGGAIDPETADSTYNAYVWSLARDLYFGGNASLDPSDPAYQRALAYYTSRAYGPQFAWSWRDRQQQQGEYRQSVVRSNRANSNATTALSVLIANHVLSFVDAYVTLRLQSGGAGRPSRFSATVPWARVPGLARPRR